MKIFVTAKTRSKLESIEQVDDTTFVVSVKALPTDGKANKAIIRLIAFHFKVTQSQVELISGASSRKKVFKILYEN